MISPLDMIIISTKAEFLGKDHMMQVKAYEEQVTVTLLGFL